MGGGEALAGAIDKDEDVLAGQAANAGQFARAAGAAGEVEPRHIAQRIGDGGRGQRVEVVARDDADLTGIVEDRNRVGGAVDGDGFFAAFLILRQVRALGEGRGGQDERAAHQQAGPECAVAVE